MKEKEGSNEAVTVSGRGRCDLKLLQSLYQSLLTADKQSLLKAVVEGSRKILCHLGQANILAAPTGGFICISLPISAILCSPVIDRPENSVMVPQIGRIVMDCTETCRRMLLQEWSRLDRSQLTRLVEVVQQFITLHLYEAQAVDHEIESATGLLEVLFEGNETSNAAPYSIFYNDAVNSDDFNIVEDYKRWKNPCQAFSFCDKAFVYDPASKSRILQLENDRAMCNEFQDALLRSVLLNATSPYFVLRVRRSPYLVHDTLQQVEGALSSGSLKKPLKVQFIGEEGVDEGGIAKEFFQLLLRDIFDPDYGMFQYDDVTRLHWFRPSTLDQEQEYKLIGIMIGLAIYNSQLLELNFPMVLFKKLTGNALKLDDLREVYPEIHHSLEQLLSHNGDVESDFRLTFQVEYETAFGELNCANLGAYDGGTPVTNDNREEFVELYLQNLLVDRIAPQYEGFSKGFYSLCSGPALRMFRAEELESLICGSCVLDFEELQRHTVYENGFTKESTAVTIFWAVVHSFSEEQKKLFLSFVTGSGRVPIKGLSDLHPPFTITKNGSHSERLPTAHTCFNIFLLPDYNDRDTLERCLRTAINNSEGFGLM